MKLSSRGGLEITNTATAHGETETRFVAAFNTFIQPLLADLGWEEDHMCAASTPTLTSIENFSRRGSSCVFVSKDTDVTMILALAERLRNRGLIHVLGENIVDIDSLLEGVRQSQVQIGSIACAYVLGDAISRREHAVSRMIDTSELYYATGILLKTLICSFQATFLSS